MTTFPLLSVVTFLPLVGALLILLLVRGEETTSARPARYLALFFGLANFALALLVLAQFDPANTGFQLVEKHVWMAKWGIAYHKGIDGLSVWFVLISAFLTPICVLSAFSGITKRTKEFMIALLVLETMMIGMFTALDLVLLYLFFEGVLIPMYLMIGIWGGPGRVYAAYKFFLYTFAGSVLLLLALITLAVFAGTTDMPRLMANPNVPFELARWLWLAFLAAFAVKTPMWPFHTWLPFAHVEAPTAGSVMLAGVLLKMGGYGLIRLQLQLLPEASHHYATWMLVLSVIAIIYTSLVALAQSDMKKLIAYSSVAHMGFVTLGLYSGNIQGIEGAVYVMLSHTIVSSALFLGVGVVYDRLHTREISRYGALANNMPRFALVFMIFTLASIGLPGTSGFIGEFLAMQGAYIANNTLALLAATGVVLGAAYMLWLYRRVFYGEPRNPDAQAMPDLSAREHIIFLPLIVLVFWLGIYPQSFKNIMSPTLNHITDVYQSYLSTQAPGGEE